MTLNIDIAPTLLQLVDLVANPDHKKTLDRFRTRWAALRAAAS